MSDPQLQERLAELILALKATAAADNPVLKWVTALAPALAAAITGLILWKITAWQFGKESASRLKSEEQTREEQRRRDGEQRNEAAVHARMLRNDQREREFRAAVGAWAAAAFKYVEAQRHFLTEFERARPGPKSTPALETALRYMQGSALEERTAHFLAIAHAPTVEMKARVRGLATGARMAVLQQIEKDPGAEINSEDVAARADEIVAGIQQLMDGLVA